MSILALETASMVCGVAIARGGSIVAEQWVEERSIHAERLFGLVDGVLHEAGCEPRDLRAVAVSIGPGSFTGLRIGLSAAKGFHMALGIPLVEVPTLLALGRRALPLLESRTGHILAALDARRDEVYCQLFTVHAGEISRTGDVHARTVREVVAELPSGEVVLTGDGREKVFAALTSDSLTSDRSVRVTDAPLARCSAAEVARIGETRYQLNQFADPGVLEPRYVKEVFLRSSH